MPGKSPPPAAPSSAPSAPTFAQRKKLQERSAGLPRLWTAVLETHLRALSPLSAAGFRKQHMLSSLPQRNTPSPDNETSLGVPFRNRTPGAPETREHIQEGKRKEKKTIPGLLPHLRALRQPDELYLRLSADSHSLLEDEYVSKPSTPRNQLKSAPPPPQIRESVWKMESHPSTKIPKPETQTALKKLQ